MPTLILQRRCWRRSAALIIVVFGALMQPASLWAQAEAAPDIAPDTASVSYSLQPEQARALARRALDFGNPELALRISQQILAQNPDDGGASLLLTAAYARLGRPQDSAREGRRAYRLAATAEIRLQAAYLTAEALAALNRPAAAKLWLRRADMAQPSPPEAAHLRRAFAQLDQKTPLKLGFQLSLRPSSNVNGGSLHDSFEIWGLKIPIAQALPGTTLDTSAKLSYRVSSHETAEWVGFARLSRHEAFLAPRAYRLQPGVKSWHFASTGLDLGLSGYFQPSPRRSLRFSGQIGQRWSADGGRRLSQQLDAGYRQAIGNGRTFEATADVEAWQYPAQPSANALKFGLEVGISQKLGSGWLSYSIGAQTVGSTAAGVAYNAASTSVEWRPAAFENGIGLDLFASAESRDYWRRNFAPDLLLGAGISAEFGKISVMGFSPVATLSANRTISKVVVRDVLDIGLSIGLNSRF